jgi:membrane associated rhomboid family serine protease
MFRNITPVVQNLLLINIIVFVVANFVFPVLYKWFPLFYFQSVYFKPFQFLTYMFMHADFWHLFSNMLGLLVFGPLLEQFLGPKKLLTLWMVCGVGAGVLYSGYLTYEIKALESKAFSYEANPDPETFNRLMLSDPGNLNKIDLGELIDDYSRNPTDPILESKSVNSVNYVVQYKINTTRMVGASGALFGILIAFGMLFPNTQLFLLFPPMPVKAKYLVGVYALYTIYNVFLNSPTDNVAHFAHLSGLLIGAVLVYYWKKDRKSFY